MQRTFQKSPRKAFIRNGTLGVKGLTTWTPSSISPNIWYDATDSSTITIATGVSSWSNKGSGTNNATQGTASAQPSVVTNELNGYQIIRWDGSDDNLTMGTRLTTVRTAMILCKWTATTGDYRPIFGDTTTNDYHGALASTGFLLDSNSSSTDVRQGSNYINGTWTFGNLARYTTWTMHAFVNFANTEISKFGQDRGQAGRFFYGDIAEIILLTSVISKENREKIEGYWGHRYGLTVNLPEDHPYKYFEPTL